ncbi:MAG: hypothetical protein V8R85_01740 [Frisingicoccus sp.]
MAAPLRSKYWVIGVHTEVPRSLPDLEQTVRVPTESGTVKLVGS